jgi:hypothetical protein
MDEIASNEEEAQKQAKKPMITIVTTLPTGLTTANFIVLETTLSPRELMSKLNLSREETTIGKGDESN